ncbi:unnamed protein product [marine sediment metagenome]|uniref:Holliday junction resolvase RuvC n=1 Tax=marine sediment metagenome TaxID=412755 RepID=X0UWF5_9ZZZZ
MQNKIINLKERGTWPRVLTGDPGIGGTGWAYWLEIARPCEPSLPLLSDAKTTSKTGFEAVEILWNWFDGLVDVLRPETVVMEFPKLWSSSGVSQGSAAKGDLFKLTYLIGGYGRIVSERTRKPMVLISPAGWKGQLPKKVVDARIKLAIGKKYRNHESDAVGLGLSLQGALL